MAIKRKKKHLFVTTLESKAKMESEIKKINIPVLDKTDSVELENATSHQGNKSESAASESDIVLNA